MVDIYKLNEGDKIIGNEQAGEIYWKTDEGTVCEFVRIYDEHTEEIVVELDGQKYEVEARCFDYFDPEYEIDDDLVETEDKNPYQIGDMVIGNVEADIYAYTSAGVIGTVTAVGKDYIDIDIGDGHGSYSVDYHFFDPVEKEAEDDEVVLHELKWYTQASDHKIILSGMRMVAEAGNTFQFLDENGQILAMIPKESFVSLIKM